MGFERNYPVKNLSCQINIYLNVDKFDRHEILWAIDVPHVPSQRDAKM
jgi:hypothetical protein